MNFLKYKNFLESKNIILFDHEYRISYFNINNFNIKKINNNMTGGGMNTLYSKLKQLDDNSLLHYVKMSISSNPQHLILL